MFARSLAFALLAVSVTASVWAQPLDTLLIAPFENLTGDADDAWIGAGIAESLAAGLAGRFTVAADQTAAGTRFRVTGAFQRVGDDIRITAQLTDATTAPNVPRRSAPGARFFSRLPAFASSLRDARPGPTTMGVCWPWCPSERPVRRRWSGSVSP